MLTNESHSACDKDGLEYKDSEDYSKFSCDTSDDLAHGKAKYQR